MKPKVTKDLYDTWMKWNVDKKEIGTVYCDYRTRQDSHGAAPCSGCPYVDSKKPSNCSLYMNAADHKKENKMEFKRIIANYLPNKLELI
jgi:hypothetical protein